MRNPNEAEKQLLEEGYDRCVDGDTFKPNIPQWAKHAGRGGRGWFVGVEATSKGIVFRLREDELRSLPIRDLPLFTAYGHVVEEDDKIDHDEDSRHLTDYALAYADFDMWFGAELAEANA